MKREVEQSIGNVIEKDLEEVKFHQKVEEWRDGAGSYDEVRQSLPTHDRPLLIRAAKHFSRVVK